MLAPGALVDGATYIFELSATFDGVLGAASVPDLSEISSAAARERAELLVVEIGVGVLVDAPESAELLVEFAEGCYDAAAMAQAMVA